MNRIMQLCKQTYRYSPIGTISIIIQKIIEDLIPVISVYIVAELVNQVIAMASGSGNKSTLLFWLTIMFVTEGVNWLSKEMIQYIKGKAIVQVRIKFGSELLKKIAVLKYEYFEDNKARDLVNRVFEKGEEKIVNGFYQFVSFVASGLRVVGIAMVVYAQNQYAALAIILLDIPIVLLSIRNGTASFKANQEATECRRKYQYLEEVMLSREAANERNIFGSFPKLSNKWSKEFDKAKKLEMAAFLQYFIPIRVSALAQIAGIVIIMIVLALPTNGNVISAGLFMSVTGNLIQLFKVQTGQMPFCVSELVKSVNYQKELEEFLSYKEIPQMSASMLKEKNMTIECKNLTFSYPNSSRKVLDGVNLTIEPWKNYAFVGANGSGKTTLVKLLTGIYTEYEGSILINGKEVREYSPMELHHIFSVVFQDFSRYGISVRDNILIGDVEKIEDNTIEIESILHQLALWDKVHQLPQKEHTILGKIRAESVDFSLGQWQKLAIGRSLIADAPIKILDEPTAALDPNLECEFYQKYDELTKNSGTILISHRLASVQRVDKIYVLHQGKIVEEGTHTELIKAGGIYYGMYTKQKEWYDKAPDIALEYSV